MCAVKRDVGGYTGLFIAPQQAVNLLERFFGAQDWGTSESIDGPSCTAWIARGSEVLDRLATLMSLRPEEPGSYADCLGFLIEAGEEEVDARYFLDNLIHAAGGRDWRRLIDVDQSLTLEFWED
jgi:hypothetical protein